MGSITISEEKFNKLMADVEALIEDASSLFDQDEIAKQRMKELKENPSIGKSENELDAYLKKRGVQIYQFLLAAKAHHYEPREIESVCFGIAPRSLPSPLYYRS